jgi:quercetin dioxygenase-like cupin family protein
MTTSDVVTGAVLRAADFTYRDVDGCAVATPVGPSVGAREVVLEVVRVPAGRTWAPADSALEENVVVVFQGSGSGRVGEERVTDLRHADALFAPTGSRYELVAGAEELVAYVWRTPLLDGRRHGADPRLVSSLWNEETQLRGFTGIGMATDMPIATMNFVFWPGTGSPQLCLHCGIQQPGETFSVHIHPESDEAFFAVEGIGQVYLADRWIDVEPGDVLFAPPGVPHGTRNPHTSDGARRFVTCGGPCPFDPALYERAGLTAEVR